MRRIAQILAFLVPLAMIAGLFVLYFFQRKLLYFPSDQDFAVCPAMQRLGATPIVADQDGENIRFYFYEPPDPKAIVIVFHGNAGSACDRSDYIEGLRETGAAIAVAEYPGFSNDGKSPSETRIHGNAAAVYKYLEAKNSQNLKFFLYGESLGTGVATKLASERLVAGLILQSPYTSMADLAKLHYSSLPVDSILYDRFDAEEWAKLVMAKTLIFLGDKDVVIPLEISRRQAGNFLYLTETIVFPGYGHNDLHNENEQLWKRTRLFIAELIESTKS